MRKPVQHFGPIMLITAATFALSSGLVFGQAGTGTLRVDAATGIDWDGCGAADDPCRNIQKAVNLAVSTDEIRVAAGTYTFEQALSQCTVGNTAVVCMVNKELTIRGGYSTSNWLVPNPVANLTVIDGENTNRGILVEEGPGGAAALTMKGITVTRCVGVPRDGQINAFGGGLSAVAPDSQKLVVVLEDMVFSGNQVVGANTTSDAGGFGAGGALSLRNLEAPSRLVDVVFNNNHALGGSGAVRGGLAVGGAVYSFQSAVSGIDLVFDGNSALAGASSGSGVSGGLHADALGGAVALMSDSDFDLSFIEATGNSAVGGQAGIDAGGGFGGALYAEGPDAGHTVFVTLTDALFYENVASGGSGQNGGLGNGGAVMNSKHVTVTMDRVAVIKNTVYGGNGTVNRGGSGGGGVKSTGGPVVGSSSAVFTNCIFGDNAVFLGSGGGSRGGGGGGLFVQNLSTAQAIHCTFARNTLSSLPLTGLAVTLAGGAGPVTLEIRHSIIAGHTDSPEAQAVFAADGNTAVFDTGLISGNVEETGGLGSVVGMETMITAGTAGFVAPGSPYYDYHIEESSPAVDQAVGSWTATDFDNESRGDSPDIGADEFNTAFGALFSDGFEIGGLSRWSQAVQ